MKSGNFRSVVVGLLSAILVLAGCASPPEKLGDDAKDLPGQISEVRGQLYKATTKFEADLNKGKYAFIKKYSRDQQHYGLFGDAKDKLIEADRIVQNTINPILDDYDEAREKELQKAVNKATGLKDDAKQLIGKPHEWLDTVAKTAANPAKVVTGAQTAAASLKTDYDTLTGAVATAKQAYPQQAAVLDQKFKRFTDLQAGATTALGTLQAEAAKTPPNYAVMAHQADTIAVNRASFTKEAPTFRGAIAELGSSQTVTLIDIRRIRAVIVEREHWDTDEEDPVTIHEYEYPAVPVDPETEAYFAKLKPGDFLANDGTDFGGDFETVPEIDPKQWDKLNIDSVKDMGWTDDSAEFFFGGFEDYGYCNKVRALKDGKPDLSERPAKKDNPYCQLDTQRDLAKGIYWEESDSFDGAFMGMDLYAKGVGDFSEQATETASPPGMVYVNDPNAGEWRKDNDGNDFWAFYGQYAFFSQLIGGPYPYHYRSEWDTWNRGHRYEDEPYYAGTSSNPRFGGRSSQAASRFPNSYFNKSGLRDTTVRDAGRAGRGGGSGGGGK